MKICFAACFFVLILFTEIRSQSAISDCKNPYGTPPAATQMRLLIMDTIQAVRLIFIGYAAME